MTVAELFVNLGVKGTDTTAKALKGTKDGLGDVKSASLETKAAILAVIYGLHHLMDTSAKLGTNLSNFASLTGLSTKELQQWQYAAQQVGVSADDVAGSVKGVQTAMANMLMGKGAPEGMAMVANRVGLDPKRFRDTFYMMEQLQKFARTVPPDVANSMLKSFGLSEGTIAAMRKNAFNPQVLNRAPVFSENQIANLTKVNAAWSNLATKIEHTVGLLTSKHGLTLVKDITALTEATLKLVEVLVTLLEKLHAFTGVAKVAGAITQIGAGTTEAVEEMSGQKKFDAMKLVGMFAQSSNAVRSFFNPAKLFEKSSVTPSVPSIPSSGKTQNFNVKQDLHFQHDGKDAKKTSDSVKQSVKESYRQISAQIGGY